MVGAGVPRSVIVRVIHKAPHSFEMGTDALIELTKAGVPGPIIEEMVDAMAGATITRPERASIRTE
jgi:Na+-translocating ferredoxin:NAD+ oxidoreductase RnfG subunit